MQRALTLHPDSRCDALTGIDVEIRRTRPAGGLVARFAARGRMDEVALPPFGEGNRADGLWKSTCFEAFLRATSDHVYYEFNFSPSAEFAVYRFAQYRGRMSVPEELVPRTEQARAGDFFEVTVSLDLETVADIPSDEAWLIGLSAVIEEANGRKSYWALRHPPGPPDFHHSDCFALELPPP